MRTAKIFSREEPEEVTGVATIKIPRTMGACADLLYNLRTQRLELEHEVADMKANEAALRTHIINTLPISDATGVKGKVAQVSLSLKDHVTARDWSKTWAYIKKNNAFDLVQRRINEAAVKARWDEGEKIPGLEKFQVKEINCSKLGSK